MKQSSKQTNKENSTACSSGIKSTNLINTNANRAYFVTVFPNINICLNILQRNMVYNQLIYIKLTKMMMYGYPTGGGPTIFIYVMTKSCRKYKQTFGHSKLLEMVRIAFTEQWSIIQ